MIEGEREGVRWEAGDESVQEGRERETEAWPLLGPSSHSPSPHSPGLGFLGAFLTGVTTVPLRTQGSSPRSS